MRINKRSRLVVGVGINDADYAVKRYAIGVDGKKVRVFTCPFYVKWVNMLTRAYKPRHKAYEDVLVCEEWLTFSNFKAWMEKQDWEGKQLDKDLLFRGNKIYSPEKCVFIDNKVNTFILESTAIRGKYPIGVSICKAIHKNKTYLSYIAQCSNPFVERGNEYLGSFRSPEEAHDAWLKRKLELAYMLAEMQTDSRVADAIIDRYKNYDQPATNTL